MYGKIIQISIIFSIVAKHRHHYLTACERLMRFLAENCLVDQCQKRLSDNNYSMVDFPYFIFCSRNHSIYRNDVLLLSERDMFPLFLDFQTTAHGYMTAYSMQQAFLEALQLSFRRNNQDLALLPAIMDFLSHDLPHYLCLEEKEEGQIVKKYHSMLG